MKPSNRAFFVGLFATSEFASWVNDGMRGRLEKAFEQHLKLPPKVEYDPKGETEIKVTVNNDEGDSCSIWVSKNMIFMSVFTTADDKIVKYRSTLTSILGDALLSEKASTQKVFRSCRTSTQSYYSPDDETSKRVLDKMNILGEKESDISSLEVQLHTATAGDNGRDTTLSYEVEGSERKYSLNNTLAYSFDSMKDLSEACIFINEVDMIGDFEYGEKRVESL